MSLDDMSLDGGESSSASTEAPSEKQEKQREQASKKAQAQLQKTQKDEKKARGDNDTLFTILMHFIKNPYYEDLVGVIVELLEKGFSSRYILSLVALVYPDAALHVFTSIGDHARAMKITQLHRYPEMIDFDESILHPSLREWMSLWVNGFERFLSLDTASTINSLKLERLLTSEEGSLAIHASERFLRFFFASRNVRLSETKSRQYALFINTTLLQSLKKLLEQSDPDLKDIKNLKDTDLFGL